MLAWLYVPVLGSDNKAIAGGVGTKKIGNAVRNIITTGDGKFTTFAEGRLHVNNEQSAHSLAPSQLASCDVPDSDVP